MEKEAFTDPEKCMQILKPELGHVQICHRSVSL